MRVDKSMDLKRFKLVDPPRGDRLSVKALPRKGPEQTRLARQLRNWEQKIQLAKEDAEELLQQTVDQIKTIDVGFFSFVINVADS